MSKSARSFVIPDLLTLVNFPFAKNPHYKQAGAESAAWFNGYNLFKDKKQQKVELIQSCTELLTSHFYPTASYEKFRICCDFINICFLIDMVFDEADGEEARKLADVYIGALASEKELKNQSPFYSVIRDWRKRFVQDSSPVCQKRLWKLAGSFITSVSRESDLRASGAKFSLDNYLLLRREVSAVRIADCLFEYVNGVDLPDAVFDNPAFQALYWANVDMIGLSNDIYSYKLERSQGQDANNLITLLMKEKGYGLQQAVNYVGDQFKSLLDVFKKNEAGLPSFGAKADEDLNRYIFSTKQSVVGYMNWCFDTNRYFTPEDGDVRHTLIVRLPDESADRGATRTNSGPENSK